MDKSLRLIYFLFLVIFFSQRAFSVTGEQMELIAKANNYYRDGDFVKAIELYEGVLKNGFVSAELYYNLGNANFKTNKMAPAILNYERAKRLLPGDDDIDFNLKIAQMRIMDKIESIPPLFYKEWWIKFANLTTSDDWAVKAVWSFWMCVLFLLCYLISKNIGFQKLFFTAGIGALSVSLVFCACSYQRYRMEHSSAEAIIFSPSATTKSSPDEKGTALFVLHEGAKVLLLDSVSGWKKIQLTDGSIGWLPGEAMEAI